MGRLIWASPAVLWGLLTLAIPVLIHLRLQPDLRRVAFPSLRFIPAGRLASVRRRVLRDLPLLLVRMAALAFIVAALAGPIVVTPARETAWADRVARAVVVDAAGAASDWRGVVEPASEDAAFTTTIEAAAADGLVAAAAWLRQAPPAAREVVVLGPMTRDSLTHAMLDVLPDGTGVRLVPVARGSAASADVRRLTWIDGEVWLERRDARLGDDTSALSPALDRERVSVPLEIDAPEAERALLDAAISAVLAEGTFVEGALAPVRLVRTEVPPAASPLIRAETRAAVDRMARVAAPRTDAVHEVADAESPWVEVWPGRLWAAADSGGLVVRSAGTLGPGDALGVARAVVSAMAPPPDFQRFETVAMTDAERAALERPAMPADPAAVARAGETDARWAWTLVLLLLGLEQWMRRARTEAPETAAVEQEARVA